MDYCPTIKTIGTVASYPEGTHPIRPISEQSWGSTNPERVTYRPVPDLEAAQVAQQ